MNGYVFSDEYTYQKMTNNLSFGDFIVPNYLYILFTRMTTFINLENQYEFIRLQNLLAFLVGSIALWRIALRYLNRELSKWIFLISLFFPVNTYIAFFMPEAQYYAFFWILMLTLIRFLEKQNFLRTASVGLSWACLSLIKPHAIFLIVGFVLFYLYSLKISNLNRSKLTFNWFVILSIGILTKLGIGYFLAGREGLTLFGNTYESSLTQPADLEQAVELFLKSLMGQYTGPLILFAIPIFLFVSGFWTSNLRPTLQTANHQFLVISYAFLVVLLVVVAAFTARIAFFDPGQPISRIHERYYSFIYPIFLIQLAHSWHTKEFTGQPIRRLKAFFAIAIAGGSILSYRLFKDAFVTNFIDSPSILVIFDKNVIAIFYICITIIALGFFKSIRSILLVYLLLQLPTFIYQSNNVIYRNLQHWGAQSIYEEGAVFTKALIPESEIGKIEVVGKYQGDTLRVPFKLVNSEIVINYPDSENRYDLNSSNPKTKWVLVFNNVDVFGTAYETYKTENFSLYKVKKGT